jgi:hypothetical protein
MNNNIIEPLSVHFHQIFCFLAVQMSHTSRWNILRYVCVVWENVCCASRRGREDVNPLSHLSEVRKRERGCGAKVIKINDDSEVL